MRNNTGSMFTLGGLSIPATVLIEKVSDAIGGIFRPYQIRRIAQAEADADKVRILGQIEITELQHRAGLDAPAAVVHRAADSVDLDAPAPART